MDQLPLVLEKKNSMNTQIKLFATPLSLLVLLFIFTNSSDAFGQVVDQIARLAPNQTETRSPIKENREFYIQTPFAKPLIIDDADLQAIKEATVLRVELVYTAFSSEASFDQIELNTKRLTAFQSKLPELFSNPVIEWRLIEQTGCNSPETCDELFHGFIVTARPAFTPEKTEEEIKYIEDLLAPLKAFKEPELGVVESDTLSLADPIASEGKVMISVGKDAPTPTPVEPPTPDDRGYTHAYFPTGYMGLISRLQWYIGKPAKTDPAETYSVRLTIDPKGGVQSVELRLEEGRGKSATGLQKELSKMGWKPARVDGKRVTSQVEFQLVIDSETVGIMLDDALVTTPRKKRSLTDIPLKDSTILKVIDRHKEWNDMAIVGDLTGSMTPYTVQILLWYKLSVLANESRTKNFTFFNDGDNTAGRKKIGEVGGIYTEIAEDYEDIEELALKCMRAGNGGDTPENNIEALLSAIKDCPECGEFVMVADNYASPRDMKLASQVTKPVRIIVCGGGDAINPNYLELARMTGGSVHTLNEDLTDLTKKAEGSRFMFQGVEYEIRAGAIKPLTRM